MQRTSHPDDLDRQIAALAYERFLARGGVHGHALEDWLAAETQLTRTPCDVVLVDAGSNTIALVRAVRELTGLGLAEVRVALEALPYVVKRAGSLAEAQAMRAVLELLGARVELRLVAAG